MRNEFGFSKNQLMSWFLPTFSAKEDLQEMFCDSGHLFGRIGLYPDKNKYPLIAKWYHYSKWHKILGYGVIETDGFTNEEMDELDKIFENKIIDTQNNFFVSNRHTDNDSNYNFVGFIGSIDLLMNPNSIFEQDENE